LTLFILFIQGFKPCSDSLPIDFGKNTNLEFVDIFFHKNGATL